MTMKEAMRTYRLPETTTSEDLEGNWKVVIDFGNKVLLAGYYYMGRSANNYFAAVYEHTTADKSCEGEIKLVAVSDEMFEDAGHALKWGMN